MGGTPIGYKITRRSIGSKMSCCAKDVEQTTSCCGPPKSALEGVRDGVKEYYGETLQSTDDLKTTACCTSEDDRPNDVVRNLIKSVPDEVTAKFYGCGYPIPLGIQGMHILDLGCGSGRDCYVAAALVGEKGTVTGVDMTQQQLQVARVNSEAYMKK